MSTEPPVAGRSSSSPPAGVRLEVRNLEVRLGAAGPDVVSDVSFTVRAGEVLGLVGESGSGKTTVALALLGHARRGLTIRSGQVCLDGVDLLALRPAELRAVRGAKVAYVPQDPASALNPALRIGTQLTEALRVHPGVVDDPAGRIAEVMREASLDATPEMLRRYPHQLSGGQQQRVTPGDGLRVPAVAHRARRADDRARRVDPAPRARHGAQPVPLVRRGGRLREPRPCRRRRPGGRRGGHVRRDGSSRSARQPGCSREPLHPYTRGLLAAVPSPERAEVLTGIDGQQPRPGRRGVRLLVRPAVQLRQSTAAACRRPEPVMHRRPRPSGACGRRRSGRERCLPPRRPWPARLPAGPPPVLSVRGVSASYGSSRCSSTSASTWPGALRRGRRRVRLRQDDARPLHRRAALVTGPVRSASTAPPLPPVRGSGRRSVLQTGAIHLPEPLHVAQPAQDGRPDRRPAARALLRVVVRRRA